MAIPNFSKKCAHCKKAFETRYKTKIYCGSACKGAVERAIIKSKARIIESINCVECNEEFKKRARNSRFCTSQCRVKWYNKQSFKNWSKEEPKQP